MLVGCTVGLCRRGGRGRWLRLRLRLRLDLVGRTRQGPTGELLLLLRLLRLLLELLLRWLRLWRRSLRLQHLCEAMMVRVVLVGRSRRVLLVLLGGSGSLAWGRWTRWRRLRSDRARHWHACLVVLSVR